MRGSRKKYQSTVGVVNVWGGKIKVAGEIIAFAGAAIPSGFLLANGALVSRASYANLFAAIGVTYGAGDGSTTFALPDLRGEFIRGTDNGRGVDAARVNGSGQAATRVNSHNQRYAGGWVGAGLDVDVTGGANWDSALEKTFSGISGEFQYAALGNIFDNYAGRVRPRNIAMQYLIQY